MIKVIDILVIDDHPIVGEGTKKLLENENQFSVDLAISIKDYEERINEKNYDVYLIDLNMPEKNGLELTKELMQLKADAKILIFTSHSLTTHFNYLIDAGVAGFISKTYTREQLIRTIWLAVEGLAVIPIELLAQLRRVEKEVTLEEDKNIKLTELEENILYYVAKGKSNEEIAIQFHMSKRNVERYLTKLFGKLGVQSRTEMIWKAKELNIIPEVLL